MKVSCSFLHCIKNQLCIAFKYQMLLSSITSYFRSQMSSKSLGHFPIKKSCIFIPITEDKRTTMPTAMFPFFLLRSSNSIVSSRALVNHCIFQRNSSRLISNLILLGTFLTFERVDRYTFNRPKYAPKLRSNTLLLRL